MNCTLSKNDFQNINQNQASKILKTNYHTHSNFCDGNDSLEEIVKSAIENNFDVLGFSGHSMFPFAETWHIAPNAHCDYVKEIERLKNQYFDKIKILCGFEADFIPSLCEPTFSRFKNFNPEYFIGSVHYVVTKNGFVAVDDSAQNIKKSITKLFGGNINNFSKWQKAGKKLVQEYFYLEREMLQKCDFTILGHADLVRKRNDVLHFFNENESWYKSEIKALTKSIQKSGVLVEINTGAITRGAMNDVYPSSYFLELLHEKNIPIIFSSDSHSKDSLDAHFDKAKSAAINAGYTECAILLPSDDAHSVKATIKMQAIK